MSPYSLLLVNGCNAGKVVEVKVEVKEVVAVAAMAAAVVAVVVVAKEDLPVVPAVAKDRAYQSQARLEEKAGPAVLTVAAVALYQLSPLVSYSKVAPREARLGIKFMVHGQYFLHPYIFRN